MLKPRKESYPMNRASEGRRVCCSLGVQTMTEVEIGIVSRELLAWQVVVRDKGLRTHGVGVVGM